MPQFKKYLLEFYLVYINRAVPVAAVPVKNSGRKSMHHGEEHPSKSVISKT
jgi:hypothetical protein